jgi:putative transposase
MRESTMLHRKTIKHYHEPGDVHELTFSCFHQIALLSNDAWRTKLARHLDAANAEFKFDLVAFVFMPEHVHLLVYPRMPAPDISGFLSALKNVMAKDIKAQLEAAKSPLLKRLTAQERPGKWVFRYWQEGPGYDRNMQTHEAVINAIEYIHMNPVRRKLVQRASQWNFSSARFYETDGKEHDLRCPKVSPLPAEYFQGYFGRKDLP